MLFIKHFFVGFVVSDTESFRIQALSVFDYFPLHTNIHTGIHISMTNLDFSLHYILVDIFGLSDINKSDQ